MIQIVKFAKFASTGFLEYFFTFVQSLNVAKFTKICVIKAIRTHKMFSLLSLKIKKF